MKVTCAKSGIKFKCEWFPAKLDDGEVSHPIFQIKQQDLFKYLPRILGGSDAFGPEDSYLYFLALLNATGRIRWNYSAVYTQRTQSLIANNLEKLAKVSSAITSIHHPKFNPPIISISKDSCNLESVGDWIDVWDEYVHDWLKTLSNARDREVIKDQESRILQLVQSQSAYKKIRYAKALATWASQAGSFPSFAIPHPFTERQVPLSQYWQEIIVDAVDGKSIQFYPEQDITELLNHCYDNINVLNSDLAHKLFDCLKAGAQASIAILDDGDSWHAASHTFKILEGSAEQKAVKDEIILTAPKMVPKPEEYGKKSDYLKALLQFQFAQRVKSQETQE